MSLSLKTSIGRRILKGLNKFSEANDVADGNKVAMLLSVTGETTCGLLRNFAHPNNANDITFDEIVVI